MKSLTAIFLLLLIVGVPGCSRKSARAASPHNVTVATQHDHETTRAEAMAIQAPPRAYAPTFSVSVPDYVVFAGERVDLTRYDKHERYDREINGFTYLHSTTMLLIKRANRYFPIIEPILKEKGVPDDLKYLCVIESSLDQRAVSSAGAAGLWQFMKGTGPQYGLEIYSEVDERYSTQKSTEAACAYLLEAYAKYGSWSGAALSYNAGQRRISDQLTKQQAEEALDLLLVEETSRYYYRMLAIKQIMENPAHYGFYITADQLYQPFEYKKVKVTKTIDDLTEFAKQHGITYAQLKDLNPWLRENKLTVKSNTYEILIPTKDFLYYKKGEKIRVHNPAWVVAN